MSARPGHHNPDKRDQERGEDIRAAERTLARLLGTETRHDGRPGGSWRPQQMGRRPRSGPGRFHGPPPRNPQRTPEWRYWPLFAYSSPRWRTSWQRYPPRSNPPDWRPGVLPRRGPPVAAIRAPRRSQPVLLEERRPRGDDPRGPLRGGPERSAGDPQRKPRGGLCGGPERSAKEPQTPSKKATQPRTKREKAGEARGKTRPTIVTVEENWGKGKKEDGDHSHEPTHGVLAASSRT